MSPIRHTGELAPAAAAQLAAASAAVGAMVRNARVRRRWTTKRLAAEAGVSRSLVYLVERGEASTLESYARLATALGLRLEPKMVDPRARDSRPARAEDPVHAAIVETLAARYTAQGRIVAVDEPFQHFHFAGRGDVVAIETGGPDLIHHEVKTALPNIGEAAGSWNAKRQYLAPVLAQRYGFRHGFRSMTHVLTFAWTAECLHLIRIRASTIRSLGPDDEGAFRAWWEGATPSDAGVTATVVLLDPVPRERSASWTGIRDLARLRPRYRGYADVVEALRHTRAV